MRSLSETLDGRFIAFAVHFSLLAALPTQSLDGVSRIRVKIFCRHVHENDAGSVADGVLVGRVKING